MRQGLASKVANSGSDVSDGELENSDLEDAANIGVTETGKASKQSSKHRKVAAGTFPAMGLMPSLLKAIQRKGFRQPTPIQRKAIPPLLQGKDVVGMARTGSGKTAAFILPLLHHLRAHSARVGIRALVLAPNRELALQTFSFAKLMTKESDIRVVSLIGGDSLEDQFAQMATNPDLVIATPGRLLHIVMEANLGLRSVQWIVWDEADRLMEDPTMAEQMKEITSRLSETKQTALFSATLPKALVEFAQLGLVDPVLIRLDTESKLSPDLETIFLSVKSDSKDALLLFLLEEAILKKDKDKKVVDSLKSQKKAVVCPQNLTVIFAATKHHVEYLQELLTVFGIPCTYIYGSLDQTARTIAIESFRAGKKPILIVTDVAARGIDVPLLDNVINYDFPPTPKLFVHRVGRVARAGRAGKAYSLVTPDELAYLMDVQMFLGRSLVLPDNHSTISTSSLPNSINNTPSHTDSSCIMLGSVLQSWLDEEQERLIAKHKINGTISSLKGVADNAIKLYKKTRPSASPESHRRAKQLVGEHLEIPLHPIFKNRASQAILLQSQMVSALRAFKPKQSHIDLPSISLTKKARKSASLSTPKPEDQSNQINQPTNHSEEANCYRDVDNYLSYRPTATKDTTFEDKGYSINASSVFARQASAVMLDLGLHNGPRSLEDPLVRAQTSDRSKSQRGKPLQHKRSNDKPLRRIRGESGQMISASFRSDIYDKWRSKTKLSIQKTGDLESTETSARARQTTDENAVKGKWRKPVRTGYKKKAGKAFK